MNFTALGFAVYSQTHQHFSDSSQNSFEPPKKFLLFSLHLTTDDTEAVEISCIRLCTTYFQGILVLDSFPLKIVKTL